MQIVVVVPESFNLVVQVNRAFNIPIPRTPLPSPANQSQKEPEYEDAWKDDEVFNFICLNYFLKYI